jgi:hypothetical protein
MGDYDSEPGDLIWSWWVLSEEKLIAVGDTAWELHGSDCKLRAEDHIEFAPVAGSLKEFLVEFNRFVNERENVILLFLSVRKELRVKVDSEFDRENFGLVEAQVAEVSCNEAV